MRKLLILSISLPIFLLAVQKNTPNIRGYKVEGYIRFDTDTIRGYISIPLDRDEVDYSSLKKKVVFLDSLEKSKTYRPGEITGFGMYKDDVLSHYISVAKSDNPSKKIFLKIIVDGEVMLLAETIDRAAGYTNGPNGSYYENGIGKNVYYLKIGSRGIVQIPFDKKTAFFRKKELKSILVNLPQSFSISYDEVDVSSLIKLLQNYNAGISKSE